MGSTVARVPLSTPADGAARVRGLVAEAPSHDGPDPPGRRSGNGQQKGTPMFRSPSGSNEAQATRSSRSRAPRRNLAGAALVVGGFLAAPVALVAAPASAAPRLVPAVTDCSVYAGSFGPNVVKVQFS